MVKKMEIPGRKGGLREIPSVVGVIIDIFWNYRIKFVISQSEAMSSVLISCSLKSLT